MKTKKLFLMLILTVFLAVGWLLSLRSATGAESREKQRAILKEADIYAGKELWVRAIPLYEEALNYRTADNAEIESRLLSAYFNYGDMASYNSLVEKRAAENTAAEQEYITASDSYIESRNLKQGMELVKKGIEQTGSQKLTDYYEENRYACEINLTGYQEIVPTKKNTFMPALGEEGWCYVDESGRAQLNGAFEAATPFNENGFAVVLKDGKYYTILQNGDRYGVDETGITDVYGINGSRILAQHDGKYSYYNYDFECLAPGHQYEQITANACGLAAVKKDGKWGIITDEGETVMDFVLEDVAVNSLGAVFADNRAMVKEDGGWYLIDEEGNRVCETAFPEAKAPESSGYIAVGDGEKWGFIDREGNVVIPYQYEDALSFSDGVAAVEIGVTWNYISEKNNRVIEQEFLKAQPFHNGRAQAGLPDGEALIELEYVEK